MAIISHQEQPLAFTFQYRLMLVLVPFESSSLQLHNGAYATENRASCHHKYMIKVSRFKILTIDLQ